MDFDEIIEFEEGLLGIKEEKIDPTKVKLEFLSTAQKDLSSIGKENVKMDFDEIIEFEEDIKPKLESIEGLLGIKEEKIDPPKVKLEFLSTAAKDLSSVGKEIVKTDFDQTIEFEENVKPKHESKGGLLHIKEEKIDPTEGKLVSKHLFNDGKEIVKMNFDQKIVFEEHSQPKLECKEEFLQIKEEKIEPTEVKLEFLSSVAKKIPIVGKESVKMDFDQIIVKPKLESKEELFHIKEEKIVSPVIKEERLDIKEEPFDIKEETENFKCSICVGLFDSKRRLNMHIFNVHEKKKPYECSICEKFFYTNGCLKQHNAAAHEEIKSNKCSKCDGIFSSKRQRLKTNETACRCVQPKKAYKSNSKCPKCSKCGSHFSFINTVHICVHDGKKVYKCRIVYDMCDYVSDTMWEMKSHISANHGGKKYVFKEYHKKRYECAFCGKLFEQNDSLKKQYVAVHEEKKVHKCSKCCSHSFETLDGKKLYKCSVCEQGFDKKGLLKLHNAHVHEEKKAPKCSICGSHRW